MQAEYWAVGRESGYTCTCCQVSDQCDQLYLCCINVCSSWEACKRVMIWNYQEKPKILLSNGAAVLFNFNLLKTNLLELALILCQISPQKEDHQSHITFVNVCYCYALLFLSCKYILLCINWEKIYFVISIYCFSIIFHITNLFQIIAKSSYYCVYSNILPMRKSLSLPS